ncbi:MAG: hypothetical protein LBT66_07895 [Methanobrevibacter sp.]|jgi:hypothetical protein|nr:hypothetical protein [Candidatus Methanovirga meridionalis]
MTNGILNIPMVVICITMNPPSHNPKQSYKTTDKKFDLKNNKVWLPKMN